MSIDFNSLLSVEQKQAIISQQILRFAADAYQVSLNRKVSEKTENEEMRTALLEEADRNMLVLESAIKTYQDELQTLTEQ
jgi:hypothetical protein